MPTAPTLRIAKETTTVVGPTADVVLDGPVPGYRRFGDVVGDGNACNYGVVGTGVWEARLGNYQAATNSLTRGQFLVSSTGAPVDFPAGVKKVFHKQPADLLSDLAAIGSGTTAPGASGGVQTAVVDITAAQIATSASNPPRFIPAPGPGRFIWVKGVLLLATFGSVPFVNITGLNGMTWEGSDGSLLDTVLHFNNPTFPLQASLEISGPVRADMALIENKAVVWAYGVDDPTPGADTRLRVWVQYMVCDAP